MIDAHVHFWDMRRDDDILIVRREPSLARQAMPDDLRPLLAAAGVTDAVAIQSAPNADETDHLIETSARMPEVRAVVGWVDLAAPDVGGQVQALAARPKIVGVRAMLNRVEPIDWLAHERVRQGIAAVADAGLTLDVIARTEHIPAIAKIAAAFPHLGIVVDHGASAPLRRADRQDWHDAIAHIATFANVSTKFSGLAEEAPDDWSPATLEPAFRHLLACFGPTRLMWASNWPVIDLRGGYARWAAASQTLLDRAGLSPADRRQIEGEAARRIYKIAAPSL